MLETRRCARSLDVGTAGSVAALRHGPQATLQTIPVTLRKGGSLGDGV